MSKRKGDRRRMKRLVVDVVEPVHRAVRMRCVERGISVHQYILGLLERDGIVVGVNTKYE
jgi:hypothetical protein